MGVGHLGPTQISTSLRHLLGLEMFPSVIVLDVPSEFFGGAREEVGVVVGAVGVVGVVVVVVVGGGGVDSGPLVTGRRRRQDENSARDRAFEIVRGSRPPWLEWCLSPRRKEVSLCGGGEGGDPAR